MKAFAALAPLLALAAAEPEADPQLLLGSGLTYTGLPLATRVISPYSSIISPLGSRIVAIGKREAEAEPEADPQLLLRSGLIGGLPLAHRVISPYSTLVSPYASRVVAIGKREAEAEPEADPQLLLRSGLIGGNAAPLTYTIPAVKPVEVTYNPIQYKTVEKEIEVPVTKIEYEIVPGKCVNNFGSAVPCRRKREAEADPALLLGATSYATPLAYSSLIHRPIVSSVVAPRLVAIGKREAEAEPEADPQLLLRSGLVGGLPLTHRVISPYSTLVSPYASRVVAIGKREAEAEADPQLLVSPYTIGAVAAPAVTYKAGEPIVKEIPITKLVPKVETKTIKITPAACQNYLGFPVPC